MLPASFQVQKAFVVSRCHAEPVGNNEKLLLFSTIAISAKTESTSNALALFAL